MTSKETVVQKNLKYEFLENIDNLLSEDCQYHGPVSSLDPIGNPHELYLIRPVYVDLESDFYKVLDDLTIFFEDIIKNKRAEFDPNKKYLGMLEKKT